MLIKDGRCFNSPYLEVLAWVGREEKITLKLDNSRISLGHSLPHYDKMHYISV